MQKIKTKQTMSTFKVSLKNPKINILPSINKKVLFKAVNILVILSLLSFFVVLSIENNQLFLSEISVGGAIVIMLCFINILSRD